MERLRQPRRARIQNRPVKLKLRGLNPALVGLGSYIVNAQGACNDCHTKPPFAEGGDPFKGQPEQINTAGYLAGGTPFGPFTLRNITPRANGLPANLTFDQFREVMKKGTDFKNRHPEISPLLQVMPWVVYGKMTALDIRAMYQYPQGHTEPAERPRARAHAVATLGDAADVAASPPIQADPSRSG